ncbi:hypothetical protein BOTBODRAFT_190300 [Botryobasidium botryosum FD-172 SS1]|uniref:Glutamine amidotransferase domain-containing protein n=1 Tax=Botryobasidium botryosum (strain FD-172 SS1) TaxID=930990 RepID=A0A067MGC5_BOTB1|nr:hypothetical protein BOTBODRAFT_190300 [Botryobasidium botryosum FD-172 SS1]
MSAARTIKLALLVCDTPSDAIESQDYPELYRKLLASVFPASPSLSFAMDSYDVAKMVYPPEESLDEGGYDGVLISGSGKSAYAPLPWIPPLLAFVSDLVSKHPAIKLFGVCFGHQIVARALGGECVGNERGWELGVTDVALTEIGKTIFERETLRIQQVHSDHVPSVPPSCLLLGSTSTSPVQGMVRFTTPPTHDSSTFAHTDIHILTVQGHPEFHASIVPKIIDYLGSVGAVDDDTADGGRKHAARDEDGVTAFGGAVWRVLGVGSSRLATC